MTAENFSSEALTLELRDEDGAVYVMWLGQSTARAPGPFILRVLGKAIDLSAATKRPLILDFQNIAYMNSSTITPLIRILERAKLGSSAVTVLYKKSLKWQDLSFTALQVFETGDRRIEICGV